MKPAAAPRISPRAASPLPGMEGDSDSDAAAFHRCRSEAGAHRALVDAWSSSQRGRPTLACTAKGGARRDDGLIVIGVHAGVLVRARLASMSSGGMRVAVAQFWGP